MRTRQDELNTILIKAAREGDLERTKWAIDNGAEGLNYAMAKAARR